MPTKGSRNQSGRDHKSRYRPGVSIDDALDEALHDVASDLAVPGATVGVWVGDEFHVATYGETNVEYPRAVSPATLFQVGSISKTFTSTLMMMLVEDGLISLEDPVARHLPALAGQAGLDTESMTIEHLLSHQSGFDGDHLFTHDSTAGLGALRGARRLFDPGDGFSYSNAGFSMAGVVIEAVTGRVFNQFMRERLLHPLGMDSATYFADDAITYEVAIPHWVYDRTAYVIRGAGWQPGWQLEPIDHAPGGLIASMEHLLTWCRFQRDGTASDGTALLSQESLTRLHTPVVEANFRTGIALDWYVRTIDGVTTYGHGGLTAGYASDLLVVPDRDVAFVALTNSTNGGELTQRMRQWALAHYATITETDPTPNPVAAPDPACVTGRYIHPYSLLDVTAGDDPGTIVVTPVRRTDDVTWQPPIDPPTTCAFVDRDTIVTLDNGPASVGTFGFDGTTASWLTWHDRRAPRVGSGGTE